jgi:hypothetical protein
LDYQGNSGLQGDNKMVNDLGDYLDLIKGDLESIDEILTDVGFESEVRIEIDVKQKDLDRIFTLLEDIESYAKKAQKLV